MRSIARSLKMHILGAFAIVILLIFMILSGITGRQAIVAVRSEYVRWTEPSALRAAELLKNTIIDYQEGLISQTDMNAKVADFQERYKIDTGIDISIVIYDTAIKVEDVRVINIPLLDRIVIDRDPHKIYREREEGGIFNRPYIISTVPIMLDEQTSGGYIQIDIPQKVFVEEAFLRWLSLFGGILIAGVLAVLASLWLTANLSKPLSELSLSARKLAEGNLSHRIKPTGPSEVRDVAGSFNQMADSLVSMIEEQRAFASNASHELRTPITNIRLRTEAILEDSLSQDEQIRYIQEMDEEAQRMGALVDDLIILSRFDAGQAEKGTEEIDLIRFANNLIETYRYKYGDKYVFSILTREDELPIMISLSHLTIIFRNLFENAIKFSPDGGEITWDIRIDNGYVKSIISDTGMGIPEDVRMHLFERFYRGDTSHSRLVPGSGLGLALVASVLKAYSGEIGIERGENNTGTTVIVRLPLTQFSDNE